MRVLKAKREIVKKYKEITKLSEQLVAIVGVNKQFDYDYIQLARNIEQQFKIVKQAAENIKIGYWNNDFLSTRSYKQLFGGLDNSIVYIKTNLDFLQRRANVCSNIAWQDKETTDFRTLVNERTQSAYKHFEEEYLR